MKKAGKPISVILILLIFAFTYFAVFGAENYFGVKRIIYFRNAQDIRLGMDIGGGAKATFSSADLNLNDVEDTRQKLETRLSNLRITDYEVDGPHSSDATDINVSMQSYHDDSVNYQSLFANIGEIGYIEVCEGSSSSKGTVLINADEHVRRADVMNDAVNGYYVQFMLTSDGDDIMTAAADRLSGGQISVWVDDQCVATSYASSSIGSGKLAVNMGTEYQSCLLAGYANSGSLPAELSPATYEAFDATVGTNAVMALAVSGGVLLLAAVVLLIVKYRLAGVVSAIALIGEAAGIMAIMTGFFSPVNPITLTVPVFAAAAICMFISMVTSFMIASGIKAEINNDHTIDGSITAAYQRVMPGLISVSIVLLLVSALIMGAFGYGHSFTSRILSNIFFFGQPMEGHVYYFGYLLFGGVLFNLVLNGIFSRVIVRGLAGFKALRRPSLFGGVKNDK